MQNIRSLCVYCGSSGAVEAQYRDAASELGAHLAQAGIGLVIPPPAEQVIGLQVQRRLRQARVTPVQQRGAEQVQAADGPVEQGPDDRLGGRIPASSSR